MRRLWYNGKVVSMDRVMSRYEAVGVEDGRIVFLGDSAQALQQSWEETRDLQGAMVLPGFNDSHMHLLHYAMFRRNVPLFGVKNIDEVVERCQARIAKENPAYLIGMGWNQETMEEGRLLTREDMDRISTDIPVCMLRTCIHIAACNTVMLERIRALKDVDPEVMALVDFEHGILRENAARLYMDVLPQADDAYVRELIQEGQRELNAAGITCIHSDDLMAIAGMDPIHLIDVFRQMEADGALTVRIYEQCLVEPKDFERLKGVRSDPADRTSLFRTGPRKLLQDGSLGAKSAEMIDGYVDEPDNHGIPIYTEEELFQRIQAAHDVHMDVAVHAIGDLALKKVCDAMERAEQANPWPEHRHGIVHAQTTTPALLERMKELGLQAYIQPIFIDADMNIIAERVGEEHAKDCYNWKAMEDLGLRVSGGSDCPVEPFDILDNMRAAITRQNRAGTRTYLPDQALSVEQAVRLFTSDAAWPSRDEGVRGTLEMGMLADLVVLDRDLFAIQPSQFPQVKVLETVLNGTTVYQA
ncbi:amidohydrolase [Flavonifractor hominis]|uniref:Amidohydrolase n=1 Tax=Flavonifractor hominis TaxID=3133178 RepID=A0ABV1END0_9FIRM